MLLKYYQCKSLFDLKPKANQWRLNEHEFMRLFSLLYGLSRLIITQQLHFHAIFLPKTERRFSILLLELARYQSDYEGISQVSKVEHFNYFVHHAKTNFLSPKPKHRLPLLPIILSFTYHFSNLSNYCIEIILPTFFAVFFFETYWSWNKVE